MNAEVMTRVGETLPTRVTSLFDVKNENECVIDRNSSTDAALENSLVLDQLKKMLKEVAPHVETTIYESLARNDTVRGMLLEDMRDVVKRMLDSHKKFKCPYKMNENELKWIQGLYPEYVLQNGTKHQGHPLAANLNLLTRDYLMRVQIRHLNVTMTGDNIPSVLIKNIGGKIEHLYKYGVSQCHTCCPVLDYNDQRRRADTAHIASVDSKFHDYYNQIDPGTGQLIRRCDLKGSECRVSSKYVLMEHSCYDMTVAEFAQALVNSQCDVAYVTYFFPVELFELSKYETAKGVIQPIGMKWRVSKRNRRWVITFNFSDGSHQYEHDLKDYTEMIAMNSFVYEGVVYSSDILIQKDGFFVQKWRKCREKLHPSVQIRTREEVRVYSYGEKYVKITGWIYDLAEYGDYYMWKSQEVNGLKLVSIVVLRSTWQKVLSFAMNLAEKAFLVKNVHAIATSINEQKLIIAGQSISDDPMPSEKISLMVVFAYQKAFADRNTLTRSCQTFSELEQNLRAYLKSGRIYRAVYDVFSRLWCVPLTNHAKKMREIAKDEVRAGDFMKGNLSGDNPFATSYAPVVEDAAVRVKTLQREFNPSAQLESPANLHDVEGTFVRKVYDKALEMLEEEKMRRVNEDDVTASLPPDIVDDGLEMMMDTPYEMIEEEHDMIREKVKEENEKLYAFLRVNGYKVMSMKGDGMCGYEAMMHIVNANTGTNYTDKYAFRDQMMQFGIGRLDYAQSNDFMNLAEKYRIRVEFVTMLSTVDGVPTFNVVTFGTEGQKFGVFFQGCEESGSIGHYDLLVASDVVTDAPAYPPCRNQIEKMRDEMFESGTRMVKVPYRMDAKTRGEAKMRDMKEKFGFHASGKQILDVGAAPGGFCRAFDGVYDGYSMLSKAGEGVNAIVYDDDILAMTGVRTHYGELEDMGEIYRGNNYDYIFCDAAVENYREGILENERMQKAFIDNAPQLLMIGGTLVLKIFDASKSMMADLAALSKHFVRVEMYKPESSTATNDERYMVYIDYQPDVRQSVDDELYRFQRLQGMFNNNVKLALERLMCRNGVVNRLRDAVSKVSAGVFPGGETDSVDTSSLQSSDYLSVEEDEVVDVKTEIEEIEIKPKKKEKKIKKFLKSFKKSDEYGQLDEGNPAVKKTSNGMNEMKKKIGVLGRKIVESEKERSDDVVKEDKDTRVSHIGMIGRCDIKGSFGVNVSRASRVAATGIGRLTGHVVNDAMFAQCGVKSTLKPLKATVHKDLGCTLNDLAVRSVMDDIEIRTPTTTRRSSMGSILGNEVADIDDENSVLRIRDLTTNNRKMLAMVNGTEEKLRAEDALKAAYEYAAVCEATEKIALRSVVDSVERHSYERAQELRGDPISFAVMLKEWQASANFRYVEVFVEQDDKDETKSRKVLRDAFTRKHLWTEEGREPRYIFDYRVSVLVERVSWEYKKIYAINDNVMILSEKDIAEKLLKVLPTLKKKTFDDVFSHKGVPGCGKTTMIVKALRPGDVVLSSTREGKTEILRKVRERADGEALLKKITVATADSYLMNGKGKRKSNGTMHIDEYLMKHRGAIAAAALCSQVKSVVCYGDSKQIPYIERVQDLIRHEKYASEDSFIVEKKFSSHTYRCPQDVARFMTDEYADCMNVGNKVTTSSKIVASIGWKHCVNVNEIPYQEETQYLTFTQNDKNTLKCSLANRGHQVNVNTINEVQGHTRKNVVLYRHSENKQLEVYSDKAQLLVGITRHTNRFTYYTAFKTDAMVKIVEKYQLQGGGRLVSPRELESLQTPHTYEVRKATTESIEFFSNWPGHVGPGYKHDVMRYSPSYFERDIPSKEEEKRIVLTCEMKNETDSMNGLERQNAKRFRKSVVVYAGPGSGKSVLIGRLPSGVAVYDTDDLDDEYDPPRGSVIFTDRPEIALAHDNELTIVFLPDRETWVHNASLYDENVCEEMYDEVERLRVKKFLIRGSKLTDVMSMRVAKRINIEVIGEIAVSDATLQRYYDLCVDGASILDTKNYGNLSSKAPVLVGKFSGRIEETRARLRTDTNLYMSPILRTSMIPPRTQTLDEELLAASKRNLDVADLESMKSPYETARQLVRGFVDSYMSTEGKKNMRLPIFASTINLEDWTVGKGDDIWTRIEMTNSACFDNLSRYEYLMKLNSKPVLQSKDCMTYPALQTIAAHAKNVNAYFCPIVKAMKEKLLRGLNKNVSLFMDVHPQEFAKHLDLEFPAMIDDYCDKVEADISKYDKSQGLTALLFECEMMREFGIDAVVVDIWFTCHVSTVLKSMKSGMKMYVNYQRKSGDAMTLLGNTIFNMAVCALAMRMENVQYCCFAGDDSIFWGKNIVHKHMAVYFEKKFNLDVKVLHYRYVYFCSKFLLHVDGQWVFFPDPLKLLTKLGRHDVRDFDQLEEYRRSVSDLFRGQMCEKVAYKVSLALVERYELSFDPFLMVRDIMKLVEDKGVFHSLFAVPDGVVLLKDPSRPKLE